ncbi:MULTISPECIES: 2-hydroxyacid dehydrogenase [unclassified Nocardioides]|uniref:2-hydroxyacid dehydrogenase n=1 Tax=unclassified Nocardioides TaxID=2615069 RepID=UPI000703B02C|nr:MULTISPECIES: D-glycerate dehydrogenase [unclassified Nocardioides]KRC53100.1 D-glycerate dehydrogenase [Nocardioides sp. Root79]KRC72629.1 D-glycerate dehydrogenase [Nocardioides sp. Root240]
MPDPHVFLTRPVSERVLQAARESLPATLRVHADTEWPPDRPALLDGSRGASGLITMLTDKVDDEVLEAAGPQLRVVANVAVGFDNIDVDAAARRGIIVTNTPGVLDEATADLTLALILSTTRRLVEADRFVRTATPWIWGPQSFVGLDLSAGATLGIVGLGRIGMATARRAHAFGMRILATGSRATSEEAKSLGVESVDLAQLLGRSDVVSLHCPLTEESRHLIGGEELAAMRKGSYLINTARGPLVDEEALADAIECGHLAGAGLDVHENEPRVNDRLRRMDEVVVLPHIGSAGAATRDAMAGMAVDNVVEVLSGRAPLTPVTG